MRYVWWNPWPFAEGQHTASICRRIDGAIEAFEAGTSSFLHILVPFRHGKSDIVSRALPAYFLGRQAELNPDLIMTGYGADLIEGFSRDTKRLIRSEAYRRVFPGLELERGRDSVQKWGIDGSTGTVTAVGLGGAITGKGGVLIIVDDYCKSREDARSETIRNKVWYSFTNDVMTRRAPTSIVIVCATPWHVDDIGGRLAEHMGNDKDFPQFERIAFPARNEDGTFLFGERYDDAWYRTQYATLGKLSAGLLDCAPMVEGGNRFAVDKVQTHDNAEEFPAGRYWRGWDLASTAKERSKDNPDYTVGVLALARYVNGIPEVWVKDAVYCREEAPKRDAKICATADTDAAGVNWAVEGFGGYKDAASNLKEALKGKRLVKTSRLQGDKEAKAAALETPFEFGNVHILRAPWNALFLKQFHEFPDGAHDDFVDATAIVWHECCPNRGGSVMLNAW